MDFAQRLVRFGPTARWLGGWVVLGLLTLALPAAEPVTRLSLSQQFIVHGLPIDQPLGIQPSGGGQRIQLEPATTVVSCERIKQAVLRELQLPDAWKGKIYVRLHVKVTDDEVASLEAVSYLDGWVYHVSLPDQMDRRRFFKTMVQVILLEIANRGAREISSELPPWMGEGLAAYLEAKGELGFLVEPFSRHQEVQRYDGAVKALKEQLRNRPALTLDQLNWPSGELADPVEYAHYRSCAQLFVSELLRLEGGPSNLGQMLTGLPRHLNWQTGFLEAFQPRFSRLVDLDKWWTVTVAHFIGRDQANELPAAVALSQLSDLLSVPLDVHLPTGELPNATRASLQQLISSWEPVRLDPVLSKRIVQLQALQWRSPQGPAVLASEYRQVLADYLSQRNAAGGGGHSKTTLLPNAKIAMKKVIQQLDQLDQRRERMEAQEAALSQSRKAAGRTTASSQAEPVQP